MSLATEFIENSSDFWNDVKLQDIDGKHSAIINEIQKLDATTSTLGNRNWAQQSDMSSVAQINLKLGLKYGVVRPIYRMFFCRSEERAIESLILDDIAVLESIGARQFLRENPVHVTPGVGNYCITNGFSVNQRWLRYLYLAHRILSLDLLGNGAWIDVGSYYGGLQGIVHRYNKNAPKILVDFHHQLLKSFVYLKTLYPNSIHVFPDAIGANLCVEDLPPDSFVYCPVTKFAAIGGSGVDLASNFFSFGEMSRKSFLSYFNSSVFSYSRYQYCVNRFVSAPFFEPTYDTDLTIVDYLGSREIHYFDVFPMHHYHQVKRSVFGRTAFRNTSSSYFELIC